MRPGEYDNIRLQLAAEQVKSSRIRERLAESEHRLAESERLAEHLASDVASLQDRLRPLGGSERGFDRAGAVRDRDRLYERVDRLSEVMEELRGKTNDLDSRVQVIQDEIADLKAMIGELAEGGDQSAGATFQPVAQLSFIEDEAQSATEDNDNVERGFWHLLQKKFHGIWVLLWRLLSRFRTVKEWSLSGELGPVLGKVAVSVTFG